MFNILTAVAAYLAGKEIVKEKKTKEVPAENWGDGTAWKHDVLSGVSIEERMKKLHDGSYKDIHYDLTHTKKPKEYFSDDNYAKRNEEYLRKKQERMGKFTIKK